MDKRLIFLFRRCDNGPSGASPEGSSGSVIDLSQLPSPSPSGSYHPNRSDSASPIRVVAAACSDNGPSGASPEGSSGSVIDLSQLPSPLPSGSYHPNRSDSASAIRVEVADCCDNGPSGALPKGNSGSVIDLSQLRGREEIMNFFLNICEASGELLILHKLWPDVRMAPSESPAAGRNAINLNPIGNQYPKN